MRDNVKLHGFCDTPTLEAKLAEMHVAVFPLSPDEPFAYVVIEAIRAGLPVVVTREAGCAEFLPETYPLLLNDRDDSKELAGLLTFALENPVEIRQWQRELQHSVEESCDLQRKCLPRCIEFLASGRTFFTSQEDAQIASLLSGWQSLQHLQTMQGPEATKARIGKKLESWVRRNVPYQLRMSLKSRIRKLLAKKAA